MGLSINETAPQSELVGRSVESLLLEASRSAARRRRQLHDIVVARSLGLARSLAYRYRNRGEPIDDLMQVAFTGLVLAARRFQPANGVKFTTFATPTILGELRRYFRDQTWTIRPPRRLQEDLPRVRRAIAELEQTHGSSPSADQVATELGTTVDAVQEAQKASGGYRLASLEAATEAGSAHQAVSLVQDPGTSDIDRVTLSIAVGSMLSTLDAREREIVRLRYFENLTQQEVANRIGVSQMQVSRLLRRILDRLRMVADEDLSDRRSV